MDDVVATEEDGAGESGGETLKRLAVGDLLLDLGTREVYRDGEQIELPRLSYQLLLALANAAPNMLSLDDIIEQVWPGRVISPETVTQRVRLLRRALGDDAQNPTYIGLVRGEGYRLLVDVEAVDPETNETRSLVAELSRRRVLQVAALYVAIAWSLTEAVSFVIEAIPVFPAGANRVVAILFVVGFPIAMFLAWQFDIDRHGGVRVAAASPKGRFTILGALVLLVGSTTGLYYLVGPVEDAVETPEVAVAPPNTVAVMPFINASGDAEFDFISDGLGDELRDQLGRLGDLRVAARTSTLVFKDAAISARDIANQLGVRWLVESTFRKQGDMLRISIKIIDGESGFQTWSESVDHLQSDLLAAQQDIATRVVAEILPSAASKVAATSVGSANVSAQTLMLLGRHVEQQVRDEGIVDEAALDRAIRLYRQATESDPNSALAHSRLAGALLYKGEMEEAKTAIDRALELDDKLSDAYYSLGLYHWRRLDPAGGAAYERAVELNPNNPLALAALAKWLWHNDLVDKTGELFRQARDLDPLSLERYSDLGNYYGITGNREPALEIAERVEELFPNVAGYRVLARIYEVAGDLDIAIGWASKAKLAAPRQVSIDWQLAELYARIGDDESAYASDDDPSVAQLFFLRRYGELIDVAEELLFDNPNDLKMYYALAFAYNTQAYYTESARLLSLIGFPERVLSDARAADAREAMFTYAGALDAIGRKEEALMLADWAIEHLQVQIDTGSDRAWWTNLYQACAYALKQQEEPMFERLERVPESPGLAWFSVLKDAYCFQPYIAEPRYLDVVEKLEARMAEYRAKVPAALAQANVPLASGAQAKDSVGLAPVAAGASAPTANEAARSTE